MSKTKKKETTSDEKFTLVELVASSDVHYPRIIMNLSKEGLLKQFEEEVSVFGKEDITPSMTEAEFKKIAEA
ncbi:MAG: hypothetical protein IKF79_09900 [Methanosphaera sp.]|nr:hypothetical protein [Methanosphaera sp.]